MAQPLHPELICSAGTLPSLMAAIDNGADCVCLSCGDEAGARNFGGPDFSAQTAAQGICYAHARNAKVVVAIDDGAQAGADAVDLAAALDVDAVVLADRGVMRYAAERHPELRLHLAVQSPATMREDIELCARNFAVRRAVLPRALPLAQVAELAGRVGVEIEVFGGSAEDPGTLDRVPALVRLGVTAIDIEGAARTPASVASVTRAWRAAIDACVGAPSAFAMRKAWRIELAKLCEERR